MSAARPQSCNVLTLTDKGSQLWRFETKGNRATALGEIKSFPGQQLPGSAVGKSWSQLWRTKLNIAWLPADQVFLRVAQFPQCDPAELPSMVEFQLEKISPMPVAQIVWSAEPVSASQTGPEGMQTVVVLIADRKEVEKLLGDLEGQGYLADRLEAPFLHQLLQQRPTEDGAWLYPETTGPRPFCLTAWWCGGTLRHLSLLHLSKPESWRSETESEISRITWAGELEGWLTVAPKWHLVADHDAAGKWAPILEAISESAVAVAAPPSPAVLAEWSASRAAFERSRANLLPEDVRNHYRQKFIDRLWLRGIVAVVVLYMIGVAVYFGALQTLAIQKFKVDRDLAAVAGDYKKATSLRERNRVLTEQSALKFAALDVWKVITDKLPPDLTLSSFSFHGGKHVLLSGTVPADQLTKIADYNEALSQYKVDGAPYFADVAAPSSHQEGGTGSNGRWAWNFTCELKQADTQ